MEKKRVAAFDFDGTITRKDTLIEFIRFAKGDVRFLLGFLSYSPLLVAFKLKLYPNWKAKQHIFTHFFKGMPYTDFRDLGERFYQERGKALVYKDAEACVLSHLAQGDDVVIISASVTEWVRPFAEVFGVKHLLATQVEVTHNGKLTGRFSSANCYGAEKVARLNTLFPNRDHYTLTAYGDSRGDKEMLAFADKGYYRHFHR